MNTVEYGRVAAEMANIIDDELTTLASEVPSAEHIDVIVQMGYNSGTSKMNTEETDLTPEDLVLSYEDKYDIDLDGDAFYSNGGVNYSNISNEIIINELESAGAIDAIDGVVAHVYSLGEDNTWARVSELQNINETWLEQYPELEVYVTEWNLKGISGGLERDEDYGLFQAKEILNLVEEFVGHGVDFANVWPLIQNTSNAFNMGFSYDEPNAPGAIFSLLAENLPGKSLLDLNPMNERKTEAEFEDMTVHGFADQEDLILYIAAGHDEGVLNTNLDIGELVLGFDSIEITVVGVEEGSLIGSNDSTAEIEIIDSTDAVADGFIDVPLDPHEIVQVIIRNYEPSDALAEAMQLDEFIVDEVEADEEDLDEV
jgi:hypothetical protein